MEWEARHAEVPNAHLIIRELADRSDPLDGLPRGENFPAGGDAAWAERSLERADEVRRPEPGARRPPRAKLPPSRDFR